MRYDWAVPLAAAIANSLVCFSVVRQGLRDRLHRAFAWMAFTIILWNFDIFALNYFSDAPAAEFWSAIGRVGVCLAPIAGFHFTVVLADSHGRLWRGLLAAAYATGFLLSVANFRGELVTGLTRHPWGWYPEPGHLYLAVSGSLVFWLLLAGERALYAYRHSASPRRRVQAKFWLLSWLIQVPFELINLLVVYGFNMYPLGSLGNAISVGIVAYAIVRHRLMDVDYVVRKVVSFCLAASAVLVPGSIGLTGMMWAMNTPDPLILTCAAVALALLSVVLVPRLEAALETRVHRAFFPNLYDYRRTLGQLAATLVRVLDEHELMRRLGDRLTDILDLDACNIFVCERDTAQLRPVYPEAEGPEPLPDELREALDGLGQPALSSELADARDRVLARAAAVFQARGFEVVIPLRAKQQLLGLIALGTKRDMRIFSAEDLQLLETVAAGASVALENARLSRQLRQSETALERANRLSSVGILAAGIAHEIRNPLVAVKTFLDLLPDRLNDPEFVQSFRLLSLSELRRVTDLISDMLALGKSPAADRRPVAVQATLEPVARLMASTASKRQVALTSTFTPGLPPVSADASQLKQIMLNLLLNAIDSCGTDGHVSLSVQLVASDVGPNVVVLEVRDDGKGIPADQLSDIFHPFFTTKETGTGLGLALVHQMVVDHGGEITVESEVGHGTVFRVSLPAVEATVPASLAPTGT